MRVTEKKLNDLADFINLTTSHKITISNGIGYTVIIDGTAHSRLITRGVNKGTYEGYTPKQAMEILEPYRQEAMNNL